MQWNQRTTTPMAILAAALMASMAMAGCMQTAGGMSFDSYEEAKSAPGEMVPPDNESEGDRITLKVLVPEDPDNAEKGEQPFVILLFDSETDQPVTDADVEIESDMPAMGHGTDNEKHPTHQDYGVYQGQINFIMPGEWVTHVDVYPADGAAHSFEVWFKV